VLSAVNLFAGGVENKQHRLSVSENDASAIDFVCLSQADATSILT